MRVWYLNIGALVLLLQLAGGADGQTHFVFTSNTGNNATMIIPVSAHPDVGGTSLSDSDEIGAFSPAGLCVGAIVWENVNDALTVWGDDDQTPVVDGLLAGQKISYRFWQKATNKEYDTVDAAYSQGDGTYGADKIFILASLHAPTTAAVSQTDASLPATFLFQNSPNPFNPSTDIAFDLCTSGFVELKVYNVLGREVRSLVNRVLGAGHHMVTFNAGDLASGVYLYRLSAQSFSNVKKMVLVK